jgi:hypothetical protein
MTSKENNVARILAQEELSLKDVKSLMRAARYRLEEDKRVCYANELLPDAGDYLRPHTLAALVRAEINEQDAASEIIKSKEFFSRLVILLPTIVRFFSHEARCNNPIGIISTIDDCHNDFHATTRAARKDRQLREAKERVINASKMTSSAAASLVDAKEHFGIEFDRYRAVYYRPTLGPSRFLGDLIDELRMCAGVLEIVDATADIKPKRLFIYGNDARTSLVEWVYHMCTMWGGPKITTTPGSDFATLCSLLYEAVSGRSDEGLAGAIIRYSRSEARKQWDKEGEDDDEDDNFQSVKNTMRNSLEEIELCQTLLLRADLSDTAKMLLQMRIRYELGRNEDAKNKYGPNQVYISQMNAEQIENMLFDAIARLKPEQIEALEEQALTGKSSAEKDIELGRARRSAKRQN